MTLGLKTHCQCQLETMDTQISTAPNCCTAVFVALLTGSLSQIHTMVLFNLAHRIYVCVGGINVNVNVTDLSMC